MFNRVLHSRAVNRPWLSLEPFGLAGTAGPSPVAASGMGQGALPAPGNTVQFGNGSF